MVQRVYHFYDHSDPDDLLFISNSEEASFDAESRELFLQKAPPNYRAALLCFNWDCQNHAKSTETPTEKLDI